MRRDITRLKRIDEPDEFVPTPGTVEERLAFCWQLSKELFSLSGKYDVEQPLQRHVTRLVRREG